MFIHLVLTVTGVFASLGDGMAQLQAELARNDEQGHKLVTEKQEIESGTSALGDVRAELEQRGQALTNEVQSQFQPAKEAINAKVDAWNARCSGERPAPVYDQCVAERGPIAAELTRVQSWGADLDGRWGALQRDAQAHDQQATELDARRTDWAERARDLVARQEELERRIKLWKDAQLAEARGLVDKRCAGKGPESDKACWDHVFDGADNRLESCLDIGDLGQFKACLDHAVSKAQKKSRRRK